ncbi:unnamed protein product [Cochlearia groenlandica]
MTTRRVKDQTLELKTWVLKVYIDCQGCHKKVQKILGGIQGVYSTVVDAELNKVTVTGNVDPDKLVYRWARSGKHAELILPEKLQDKKDNSKKQSNPKNRLNERKAAYTARVNPKTGDHVGKQQKKKKKQSGSMGGNSEETAVVESVVSTLPQMNTTTALPSMSYGTEPYVDPLRYNAYEDEAEQSGCFIM